MNSSGMGTIPRRSTERKRTRDFTTMHAPAATRQASAGITTDEDTIATAAT